MARPGNNSPGCSLPGCGPPDFRQVFTCARSHFRPQDEMCDIFAMRFADTFSPDVIDLDQINAALQHIPL